MKRKLLPAGLACVVLLGIVWWRASVPPNASPTPTAGQAEHTPPRQASLDPAVLSDIVRNDAETSSLPVELQQSLPASLAGAGRPAALTLDAQGALVVDVTLRRLFEYYLTALGEESLAVIVARIRYDLGQQLTPADFERAVAVLESYLQYRNAVGEVLALHGMSATASAVDLEQILAVRREVVAMRSDYLAPDVAHAFFREEDDIDHYLLSRQAIARDPSLTPAEKQAQLAQLEADSAPAVVAVHQRNRSIATLRREEQLLRDQGAPDETLYALREQTVGPEAAQRLAELDKQRGQWQQRVEDYRRELLIIESDSAYPEAERARLINELRERHFVGGERLRIEALDRLRPDA